MPKELELNFLDIFNNLDDPRSKRNRLYSMSEILLVALSAAICGAEGWQDLEDFGNVKINYLRQFLPYKNGIPSDDTFRRFFRAINPDAFQELFRSWVKSLQKETIHKVIAIDGKASRHSFDENGHMLHMVSAFATESRLVLAQEKVGEKSNEIKAIPELLKWLDIKGSTITIDAMGCQYKIADQITAKSGDYVLSLKGNQGLLSKNVTLFLDDNLTDLSNIKDYDKGHGRIETRKCFVSYDVEWLHDLHPKWKTIRSLICIESTREVKDKVSIEKRYYISSSVDCPKNFLKIIRSHWLIENSLHWVLDMSFGDDASRIRKKNGPQVMAVIRHMALNLLQKMKSQMKRQSIKRLRKIAGWDNDSLSLILSQNFS